MRYLIAFILIVTLTGCEHDENLAGSGTNSGAADSGAVQTPITPAFETLKVTYSKTDPYKPSTAARKDAASSASAPDHAGHDMKKMTGPDTKEMPGMDMKKETPSQEKKPSHEEHPSK